jgi:four helix bundle protein
MESFNETYRQRSFDFAVRLVQYAIKLREEGLPYDLFSQLLRAGTSFPANFRAATQARSDAEYYAKLCIVVEECDETVFWLDLFEKSSLVITDETFFDLRNEANEMVKVFSKVKGNVGKRIGNSYSLKRPES